MMPVPSYLGHSPHPKRDLVDDCRRRIADLKQIIVISDRLHREILEMSSDPRIDRHGQRLLAELAEETLTERAGLQETLDRLMRESLN